MTDEYGTPESSQNRPPDAGGPPSPTNQPPGAAGRETDPKARTWGMICHLAGFAGLLPIVPAFGSIVGPLVVWLIKKDEFPFVDEQGKEAVNFQITLLIYLIACVPLIFACGIGVFLMIILGIVDIVFLIIAAIKANDGYHYRYPYPLIIRFIK
jgi:uncharacterized Tic20 family protein